MVGGLAGWLARDARNDELAARCSRLDAAVRFELFLPGDKTAVRGAGVIVRHTHSTKPQADGFAVSFTSFRSDGGGRLEGFITNALERRSRTSLFPGIGG